MDLRGKLKTGKSLFIQWLPLTLLLVILLVAIYHNFFLAEFPYTHDGENHLARFANYKIAVREGQIPPRWAPNLLNRYGYPVFNYNYPLSNILSLPFSVLGVHYETTFKLLTLGYLLAGGLALYNWLINFVKSSWLRFLGVTLWLTAPYLGSLIYFRGNIGEIAAYGLFPLVLWSLWRLNKKSTSSLKAMVGIIFASFLLAHNVSAMFGMAIAAIVAVALYGKNLQAWRRLLQAGLVAFLLAAWFWLPALWELKEVVVASASNQMTYLEHFPTFKQLLFSPLQFGFSRPGPVDGLSFSLNWLVVLLTAIGGLWLTASRWLNAKKMAIKGRQKQLLLLFALALLLIVFQLEFTSPIWAALPLVRYIQFPWRLGLFFASLSIPLVLVAYKLLPRWWRLVVLGVLVGQVLLVSSIKAVDYFHKNMVDYDAFSQTTSTQNENMPANFSYTNIADWQPRPTVLAGSAQITVNSWRGSERFYQANVAEPTTIVEPTANFLGWQTQVTNLATNQTNQAEYLNNQEIAGRIAYRLSPGDYRIQTSFTQQTSARIIGNSLALVGMMYLAVIAMRPYLGKTNE